MTEKGESPQYISQKIGDEYKEWSWGESIFITASAGAGKSYFILHTYLKWVIEKNWRVLYLVNRKILKKQLEEEAEQAFMNMGMSIMDFSKYLSIETYQNVENGLKSADPFPTMNWMNKFQCVVCDECHYFYTDSNFNTGTELSFLAIKEMFKRKIRIYISATMDKVKQYIENDKERDILRKKFVSAEEALRGSRKREYSLQPSHEGLRVKFVKDSDDLLSVVKENVEKTKDKWLIFIDSIEKGKNIRKKLLKEKYLEEKEIVFLDTDYENDEETKRSVQQIVENKQSDKRIVISTAVMDNGITFSDQYLTNIAIFADTKETFLQMLGRKRGNRDEVNLYICKRNREYFSKRLSHIEQILRYFGMYEKELEKLYNPYIYFDGTNVRYHYMEALCRGQQFGSGPYPYNVEEVLSARQKVTDAAFAKGVAGQYLKSFCYSVNSIIIPNHFSIMRWFDLKVYYKEQVKELSSDENYFLKQQMKWLAIDADRVDEIIRESEEELYERKRKDLQEVIEELLARYPDGMSEEENIDWKMENRELLSFFADTLQTQKSIGQNERPISVDKFNRCMSKAQLLYRMKKERKKFVIIREEA